MLQKTADALRRNRYEVSVFETKEEAVDYLAGLFHGTTIGFGDSRTLAQIGLNERLSRENTVYDPFLCSDNDEFLAVARQCLTTDYFFTSVNGLSMDGILVNLDGTGNRIGGSLFGHKKVFFVVGRNKIAPDLEQTVHRVRNVAAPLNAKKYNLNTPCVINGDKCYDCSSPERICNALLIQFKKMNDMEAEVILIDEDLGF
jgi:NAD-dependent dihydropyrimidine dehydrogenase PreA subunit